MRLRQTIIFMLLTSLLPWQTMIFVFPAHAQSSSTTGTTQTLSASTQSGSDEGADDEDSVEAPIPGGALTTAANLVAGIEDRRGARGDQTIETSLPRLGMSQCDMALIRQHKIDERILKTLNYLVTPADKGGAGMTYLQVTFSRNCEQAVPELIGGAYPVEFKDDSKQPPPPKALPALATNSGGATSYADQINHVITSVSAATAAPLAAVEPPGAENVHNNGQAVDVTAAGLIMCKTSSGGVFGLGSKVTRQAPRPIKVSWQTDAGVANLQAPFGHNLDQMAQTAGLDQFLQAFSSQDGTYQAKALDGVFTMMGFNLVAQQLGIRPGTLDASTAPLSYSSLGYSLLADAMQLPDASVFNPFIIPGQAGDTLYKNHNSADVLAARALLSEVEHATGLPSGSLDGANQKAVLINAAAGRLGQAIGLQPGTLQIDVNNPGNILRAIGQSKVDSYFRWPSGTAATTANGGTNLGTLIAGVSSSLGLPKQDALYADRLVRGALHLPESVAIKDLTNKNSDFWKSGDGTALKSQIGNIDRQLVPQANDSSAASSLFTLPPPTFSSATSKNVNELTYRMITGDLSLQDYQDIVGAGALETTFGSYDNAAKPFDFPPDHTTGWVVNNQGQVSHVIPQKNQFLAGIVGGDEDYWLALGADSLEQATGANPDARFKSEIVQVPRDPGDPRGQQVDAEKISGMVADVLQHKLDATTLNISASKMSLPIDLSPSDIVNVFGEGLATDSTASDASKRSEARFNSLAALGKQQFGSMFDAAARSLVADPTVLGALSGYDAGRPSTHGASDVFVLTGDAHPSFTLSSPASSITSATITSEVTDQPVHVSLGSDHQTITLDQAAASSAAGGDTLKVSYSAVSAKGNSSAQITPDTFKALLGDPKAFANFSLQFGADEMSQAFKLPSGALRMAAGLVSPTNKTGIPGIGEAALEQSSGLNPGSITYATLDQALQSMPQRQVEGMLLLEPGWYDQIKNKDSSFLTNHQVDLYSTDQHYNIELGSTEQLINGEITLDQYKNRIGQASLRYNAGQVLASEFDVSALGYRLTAQDFSDMAEGDFYKPLTRFGARLQEKNHNLPIGSLAASIISGSNDVSLFSLGSNFVASEFHLSSINLTDAHSIKDVIGQIGVSSVEQALGLKAGSFHGSSVADIAGNVGAEDFARAFGLTLPADVQAKLAQVQYSYHPEQRQLDRNAIILQYLQSSLSGSSFDASTLSRFDQIDHILQQEKGATLRFMQGALSADDYVSKTADQAVQNRVTSGLADILGIDQAYVGSVNDMVNLLTDKNKQNDSKAFGDLYKIVQHAGGLNFDAEVGFDKGTFAHIIANVNNTEEMRKTFVSQGIKHVAHYLGLSDGALGDVVLHLENNSLHDLSKDLQGIEAGVLASKINIPGYTAADASWIANGHFAAGAEAIGAAYMANSKEMKAAGITYSDIKTALFGDVLREQDFLNSQAESGVIGGAAGALGQQGVVVQLMYRDTTDRQFMTNARQAVSYKFMDYQVSQIIPGLIVPPGFSQAMVGGITTYVDNGHLVTLTGDEARQRMGQLVVLNYLKAQNTPLKDILQGLPDQYTNAVLTYFGDGDATKLQQSFASNNNAGFLAVGGRLDPIFSNLFGTKLAPGTSAALLGFAGSGNVTQFQKDIWNSWQFEAFGFADHALGLRPGSAVTMYQGIIGYQTALRAYQTATAAAATSATAAAASGGIDGVVQSYDAQINTATRQFKVQTAMIIATVANFVFQKQIGQVESALGLKPGTLMYLVQFLIHPDPISLGLFIFFNFIWGGSSTSCAIDHYPDSKTDNSSIGRLMLLNALGAGSQAPASAALDAIGGLTAGAAANPIATALAPPASFNGADNNSYRSGAKAGAQYEVKLTLGSLLLEPNRSSDSNQTPVQIGALKNDDLLLFEKLSQPLYGSPESRGKKGPGWYDQLTDRIHVGY